MKRFLPDSIAGRIILVLLVGLTLSHLVSMAVYHHDVLEDPGLNGDGQPITQRMATIARAIGGTTEADRDRIAKSLSGRGLEVDWSFSPVVEGADAGDTVPQTVPGFAYGRLLITGNPGQADETGSRSLVLASVRLQDGTWANFRATHTATQSRSTTHLILSTTLMAAAVVGFSIIAVRVLTAPLRALAQAAERLGIDMAAPPLPETGPRETRHAARAFNEMQGRIKKLVADRTQTLAAISHDLRTPITRMRLRAELVEDDEQRAKMMVDLQEMEAMVDATLAFIREDTKKEELRVANIGSMLETICNDMIDAGRDVQFEGRPHVPLLCRPLSLKRAFTNLVDNAAKYGGKSVVKLSEENRDGQIRIDIEDEGPGIPQELQEKVFSPFFRLESSRSRATGGTGLGLTVARSIIRAHGGEIELSNRPVGGLRVTVLLPDIRAAAHRG